MSYLINPFYYLNTQPNWLSCGWYDSEEPCVSTQSRDTKNRMFCVATDPLTPFDPLCSSVQNKCIRDFGTAHLTLFQYTENAACLKVYTVLDWGECLKYKPRAIIYLCSFTACLHSQLVKLAAWSVSLCFRLRRSTYLSCLSVGMKSSAVKFSDNT